MLLDRNWQLFQLLPAKASSGQSNTRNLYVKIEHALAKTGYIFMCMFFLKYFPPTFPGSHGSGYGKPIANIRDINLRSLSLHTLQFITPNVFSPSNSIQATQSCCKWVAFRSIDMSKECTFSPTSRNLRGQG